METVQLIRDISIIVFVSVSFVCMTLITVMAVKLYRKASPVLEDAQTTARNAAQITLNDVLQVSLKSVHSFERDIFTARSKRASNHCEPSIFFLQECIKVRGKINIAAKPAVFAAVENCVPLAKRCDNQIKIDWMQKLLCLMPYF